ncbi:MAG: sulfotransferase family 2 domain-containing protein [Desulfobacteraceae bacterium]|nr:sulfotransferase family 2 domain-containing protein [Desulfobacteraceae bacterium]MBC2753948.1 sulfotransferase family 2 domain-containing protein [Desulfobacteraceae bacterium]
MYAFIHIPKTAGTTMRALLRRSFGAWHLDIRPPMHKRTSKAWISAEDLRKAQRVYPILDGICGHRVTPFNGLEKRHPELRYFTFLRDPLRRFVSDFLGSHRKQLEQCSRVDLERFCADPEQRNVQTRWLCGSEDPGEAIRIMEEKVGFVGLTEQFDESLVLFSAWLGNDRLQDRYLRKNTGRGKITWPILEDPDLRARVEEANTADIEVYRYATEVIFPTQAEAYGPGLERDVEAMRRRNADFIESREPVWGQTKRNCIYKPLLHLRMI